MALSESTSPAWTPVETSSTLTSFLRTTTVESSCSCASSTNCVRLYGSQILVKVSHLNETLTDFHTSVYDDENQEECHFVRIVRVGPHIVNKDSTVPGTLIVVRTKSGESFHIDEDCDEKYLLMFEKDILTYVDIWFFKLGRNQIRTNKINKCCRWTICTVKSCFFIHDHLQRNVC